MEQNIGKFIQELRKTKNMTQRELADTIGVSDKTISKWENGNSIPDTAILQSLCEALEVSVNELISCKRLQAGEYSSSAEVNMIKLLKENEKSNRASVVSTIAGCVLGLLAIVFLYMSTAGLQPSRIVHFLDWPSVIVLIIVCGAVVFVSGAKTLLDILKVIQKTLIPTGLFVFLFAVVVIMGDLTSPELIGPNLAVAVLTLLYAAFVYVILVPIIHRLEKKKEV